MNHPSVDSRLMTTLHGFPAATVIGIVVNITHHARLYNVFDTKTTDLRPMTIPERESSDLDLVLFSYTLVGLDEQRVQR